MKYIKKFESVKKEKFWIVTPDYPYNYIIFRKIGMDSDTIKDWIDLLEPPSAFDENEILLFNDWSWSSLTATDSDGVPYLSNPDYENMGKIIFDQDEIDAYKDADKFNL